MLLIALFAVALFAVACLRMSEYGPTPAVGQTPPLVRHIHGDQTIDYTPSVDVAAGDVVVQGDLVGIAKTAIAAGKKGALSVSGCFEFPKAASDGGMAVGTLAYWDADNSVATGTATGNKYLGKVEATAATAATSVKVQVESVANATGSGFGGIPAAAVAAAGANQGNAAALSLGLNKVTAADNTKGVKLPTAEAGKAVFVVNTVADKTLPVYPNTDDKINGGTANAAVTMAAGTSALFACFDGTDWYTFAFTAAQ